MHPARRRLTVFSAAVLTAVAAVLTALLPVTMTSATSGPAARNGVGASHPQTILTVGPSRVVSAVQRRCDSLLQAGTVAGLCVAAEDAAEDASSDLADAATCGGESFSAGTKVLLASGAAIPISQLRPGEKVLATNVKTRRTQAEPVTAVLLHHDTDRYYLIVKTSSGTSVIDTTSSHLFWDQTRRQWVKAAALKYGDKLRTADGVIATAAGGHVPADADGWMWDLSVPGGNDHDFYIDVATTAVLVHNCDIGHADIHQFPGIQAGKSQFFDQMDLGELSDTRGTGGILQNNGNWRYVLSRAEDVGVDRTTGLPTNIYTVIRTGAGRVVTLFPGTSPMG